MLLKHRLVTDKRTQTENVKVCSSLSHAPKLTQQSGLRSQPFLAISSFNTPKSKGILMKKRNQNPTKQKNQTKLLKAAGPA